MWLSIGHSRCPADIVITNMKQNQTFAKIVPGAITTPSEVVFFVFFGALSFYLDVGVKSVKSGVGDCRSYQCWEEKGGEPTREGPCLRRRGGRKAAIGCSTFCRCQEVNTVKYLQAAAHLIKRLSSCLGWHFLSFTANAHLWKGPCTIRGGGYSITACDGAKKSWILKVPLKPPRSRCSAGVVCLRPVSKLPCKWEESILWLVIARMSHIVVASTAPCDVAITPA